MINILWISLCTPYLSIGHAGGQALLQHINYFLNDNDYVIKMISLCDKKELADVKKNKIAALDNCIIIEDNCLPDRIIDLENRMNPWNRYGGYLSNSRVIKIKKALKSLSFSPDIILLNWTEMVALTPLIQRLYPGIRVFAIEEDVSYIKRKRRWKNSIAPYKYIHGIRYYNSKKKELSWLKLCDHIFVYSPKDKSTLVKDGIDQKKVTILTPIFHRYSDIKISPQNREIIFWGAMNRKENEESVIWFIENVMPKLENLNIKLIIIGSNPSDRIKAYASNNIIITGYVDDPSPYFARGLCFVCPLTIGAGIKIKVIEGLSSGVPVISNNIGIEGIPAVDRRDYIAAESAEEFARAINELLSDAALFKKLSNNGKKLIETVYSKNGSEELEEQIVKFIGS